MLIYENGYSIDSRKKSFKNQKENVLDVSLSSNESNCKNFEKLFTLCST